MGKVFLSLTQMMYQEFAHVILQRLQTQEKGISNLAVAESVLMWLVTLLPLLNRN